MREAEKFRLINQCETINDLQEAIVKIADRKGNIKGREHTFDADLMASSVPNVISGDYPFNFLTRAYGIRQQAMYLQFYNKK